jgi:heterodisulfide reductase subunit A-like polyferredoxin/coenzyme F420-reducing hydrogenase delta subunit
MRLGVFLSECSGTIGKAIDLQSLSQIYEDRAIVRTFEDFYDTEDFSALITEAREAEIDALVLGGDSPFAYTNTRQGKYLFKCLRDIGINPNRVEVVNLKNMVALPHDASTAEIQSKARLMIDAGISRIKSATEVRTIEIAPRKTVAIIGANLGSIAAAQVLLEHNFKVYLVHRGRQLSVSPSEAPHISPALVYVSRHPRFELINQAEPTDFYGFPGDYTLSLAIEEDSRELTVGAVILSFENDLGLIKMSQSTFRMDVNQDGTLASLNRQSARSLTRERGVFLIDPPPVENDDISQRFLAADSAASMAIRLLNRQEIYHAITVSRVDERLCGACGACVKTCMFNAVTLNGTGGTSEIDPKRCRGCGNCVTACPAGARDLVVAPSDYLFEAISIFSRFQPDTDKPSILLMACEGCGYESLDKAGRNGLKWPVSVMPLSVVCGGQIDMQLIMHAFAVGFDGVALLICGEGCCHNIIGNVDLERRVNLFKDVLESRGIDEDRVFICTTCDREGTSCVQSLVEFYEKIEAAG